HPLDRQHVCTLARRPVDRERASSAVRDISAKQLREALRVLLRHDVYLHSEPRLGSLDIGRPRPRGGCIEVRYLACRTSVEYQHRKLLPIESGSRETVLVGDLAK